MEPHPTIQVIPADLAAEIEQRIILRTGRRIQQLLVEAVDGKIVVRGCTSSYYFKQLAIAAIREVIGPLPVQLDIQVL